MLDKTNIKQRFSYNLAREHYTRFADHYQGQTFR
jgi:hypothetical protein